MLILFLSIFFAYIHCANIELQWYVKSTPVTSATAVKRYSYCYNLQWIVDKNSNFARKHVCKRMHKKDDWLHVLKQNWCGIITRDQQVQRLAKKAWYKPDWRWITFRRMMPTEFSFFSFLLLISPNSLLWYLLFNNNITYQLLRHALNMYTIEIL